MFIKPVGIEPQVTAELPKPKGKQVTIKFIGEQERLNLFGVTEYNVSGSWWRITDNNGEYYVIDPAKVQWVKTKIIV